MNVVELTGVTKTYGRRPPNVVLDGVDLTVGSGEIVGVLGRSGSGKSTLLRLLSGLERPDSGSVVFGDESSAPAPGQVMAVFQNPAQSLDPRWPIWRSVAEPLTAPHRRPVPPRSDLRVLAADHLERVGLGGVDIDSRPGQLSGGQCQRVAIVRAQLAEPSLLLADEPTSALDASAGAGILTLLADVAATGTGVVVVSHDAVALEALCGRVLQLRDGRLEPVTCPTPQPT